MFSASMSVKFNHVESKIRSVAAAAEKARDLVAKASLDEAKRRAPVGKTGKIRDGLQIRQLANGKVAVGVWDVREASFQENGTSKMHAHPFMHPAATVGGTALKHEAESLIRAAAEE
jgi:HK97 gp10 family phage protein